MCVNLSTTGLLKTARLSTMAISHNVFHILTIIKNLYKQHLTTGHEAHPQVHCPIAFSIPLAKPHPKTICIYISPDAASDSTNSHSVFLSRWTVQAISACTSVYFMSLNTSTAFESSLFVGSGLMSKPRQLL